MFQESSLFFPNAGEFPILSTSWGIEKGIQIGKGEGWGGVKATDLLYIDIHTHTKRGNVHGHIAHSNTDRGKE